MSRPAHKDIILSRPTPALLREVCRLNQFATFRCTITFSRMREAPLNTFFTEPLETVADPFMGRSRIQF